MAITEQKTHIAQHTLFPLLKLLGHILHTGETWGGISKQGPKFSQAEKLFTEMVATFRQALSYVVGIMQFRHRE